MEKNSLQILFVDDSSYDVELMLAELKRGGYTVVSELVETADDMSKMLNERVWDAVISDFKMPGFGAEKSLEIYNAKQLDIPFIIVSGVVDVEDVVYLLKRGAHDFLNKGSLARLLPALERELRESFFRKSQRLVQQQIKMLSSVVEKSPVSIMVFDTQGTIEYINPNFEKTTGYSKEEVIGKKFGFNLEYESEKDFSKIWEILGKFHSWVGECCTKHKDGFVFWENINISLLENSDGQAKRYVSIQEDITARRTYEDTLWHQANYDELTGLPNRQFVLEKLDVAVDECKATDKSLALLYIDLDHFEDIKESFGYIAGDELLMQASSRLAACVATECVLARVGGDEFIIVVPDLQDDNKLQTLIDDILHNFSSLFVVGDNQYLITTSIGVAKYPEDGDQPEVLLKNADLAMYESKRMGRNQCQYYRQDIGIQRMQRVSIATALRGIENTQQLELHYQPIVHGITQNIVACEALIRWRTHDGGYMMPDTFIPVAEETGDIDHLGRWVIKQVCRDLDSIRQAIGPGVKVAINISPKQLQADDFFDFVEHILSEYEIEPATISFEITENVLINEDEVTHNNLLRLCNMGIELSIDDFGTGYSSLAYLQKYPFSTLKIDRSFVNQIENTQSSLRLLQAIIQMGHGLGMKVVAEGVENIEQLELLRNNDGDLMQGYYFSKPVPLLKLLSDK